jgi:hypothetical protein|tara:strand:- start:3046 stop:3312 length:267 start_codon:yes stop_codon:yes gene_type:complete
MGITQNALGISLVRLRSHVSMAYSHITHYPDCFFEHALADELMPQANIVDFCDTFDLDGNGDIMPEINPYPSGHFFTDLNDDIMPEAV